MTKLLISAIQLGALAVLIYSMYLTWGTWAFGIQFAALMISVVIMGDTFYSMWLKGGRDAQAHW